MDVPVWVPVVYCVYKIVEHLWNYLKEEEQVDYRYDCDLLVCEASAIEEPFKLIYLIGFQKGLSLLLSHEEVEGGEEQGECVAVDDEPYKRPDD